MNHIEFEVLLNDRERRLEEPDARRVAEHLAVCADCAATARRIDGFLEFAASEEFAVSQAVTANLLNIYKPKKQVASAPSMMRRFVAALAFDDWQTALSERFDGRDSRQMLFRAGEIEIDLRLEFSGGKCRVSGQIFGGVADGEVELISDDFIARALVNEDAEFFFEPIARGVYSLRFTVGGETVEIERIEITNE